MAQALEKSWPASKVELWPVAKIVPYDSNPRTHSDEQIAFLAKTMKEDGVTQPIIVDEDGIIIAGHGRRLAALKNGFARFPVVIAKGWSDKQKRAVRIKDNSLAALSGWDVDLIRVELNALQISGYDIQQLGFDVAQLSEWSVGVLTTEMPPLPNGQKNPYQQMTFIVHESHVETIKKAIDKGIKKLTPELRADNKNKNGAALWVICKSFAR
jgi:hypothetical protein